MAPCPFPVMITITPWAPPFKDLYLISLEGDSTVKLEVMITQLISLCVVN